MAPSLGAVVPLDQDRVRRRRWTAEDTDLGTVVAQLRRLEAELMEHDVDGSDHAHPRNSALNLVVTLSDRHQVEAADRLIVDVCVSHPLRAILLHLGGGGGTGTLDAEVTAEAHQLLNGFPVQREQVLLHVRGQAARHLASLVQPLLVPDLPTYLWWSGRQGSEQEAIREAMGFSDMLVVDSSRFERPARSLLELASLAGRADAARIGVADLCWERLRPWREAVAQCFAPADRRAMTPALRELEVETGGGRPELGVSAALLAGWVASALGWAVGETRTAGEAAIEAAARRANGEPARIVLRPAGQARAPQGSVVAVRLGGRARGRDFRLTIERDPGGGSQAELRIDFGEGPAIQQLLMLPRMDDPDLLVHVLWTARQDPVFSRAMAGATALLEALR